MLMIPLILLQHTAAGPRITVGSAVLASDGTTLTVGMANYSGTLAANSNVTGFKARSGGNVYYPAAAVVSGANVVLTLGFPIASGAAVTLDLASTSNLRDTAGNSVIAATSFSVTNNSTMSVLAVPFANANPKWSGSWAAPSVFSGRNIRGTPVALQSEVDFGFSGTSAALVIWAATTAAHGSSSVDGAAASTIPGLSNDNNSFAVLPLASGLTDAAHTVKFISIVNLRADDGTNAGSGNATLLIASPTTPAISAPAGSWGVQTAIDGNANIAVDGSPVTTSGYGSSNYFRCGDGNSIRFAANSALVGLWGFQAAAGVGVSLYQDGVLISDTYPAIPLSTFGRVVLATGLDTLSSHEYEIIVGASVASIPRTTTLLGVWPWAIELDSGSLTASAHSSRPTDTFHGDSITADIYVQDYRNGDSWQVTRALGRGNNQQGNPSAKLAFGLANVTQIPAASARVISRWGHNDLGATTIGAVGSPGTYTGDYYSYLVAVRARIGAGKMIYVEGVFPQARVSDAVRQSYNTAAALAVSTYITNTGDAFVQYINTDNWLIASAPDLADGTVHPGVPGYTKIENRELPYFSPTGVTASGPSSGASGVASTNFTVTMSTGATFTGDVTAILNDGGAGGTFTPSVGSSGTGPLAVMPANGASSFTFTYTPASPGTKTLALTNGQGWGNPASLSYVAS